MELSTLGITPAKSNQFNTKGIDSVEELLQFIPRKYLDFSKETGINLDAEYSCFKMYVNSIKSYINKTPMIAAFGFENNLCFQKLVIRLIRLFMFVVK